MAIISKLERKAPARIVIDLAGPDGNAWVLIGYARNFSKQLGKSNDEIRAITEEMMSGDYENLLQVFDREFGSFADLQR